VRLVPSLFGDCDRSAHLAPSCVAKCSSHNPVSRHTWPILAAVHTGIITEEDSLADRLERLFEQLVGIAMLGTGAGGTR
jgi:hypothetical protein